MASSRTSLIYEIKKSRTGEEIPVINGVHLHSIYNPNKEAESLVDKHDSILAKKNKILVFGLGFGYHIREIVFRLKRYHGEKFEVSVIEPCKRTVENYIRIHGNSLQNIFIYSDDSPEELYKNHRLIDTLSAAPAIISHPASFNLFEGFFKNFLSYRASTRIEDIAKLVEDPDFKDYLNTFPSDATIEDCDRLIPSKSRFISNPQDFLVLAYNQITANKLVQEKA